MFEVDGVDEELTGGLNSRQALTFFNFWFASLGIKIVLDRLVPQRIRDQPAGLNAGELLE